MNQRFYDSTSEYICEETQNTTLKVFINPYVHCSVIYSGQEMEVPQVPIYR